MPRKSVAGGPRYAGTVNRIPSHRRNLPRQFFATLVLTMLLLSGPVAAARFTLETDHFLIHFDGDLAPVAQYAAVVAEEVHRELSQRIGHTPREKTHLVLLDETDMANGFADPLLYPKITIYPVSPTFSSPYRSGLSPRLTDWLKLVILHEYAHALHLDLKGDVGQSVERLFGRVPFITNPMLFQSPAFIEGFATYYETVAELGGRGEDPFYRMFLRAMVLEDDILSLDQILGHYPLQRWKPGAAVYLYGFALWQFMADRYGEDALMRFNRSFARTLSLSAAFEQALETSPESFYQAWQDDLKARFTDELAILRARGTTPTEILGGYGYVPESPTASPDGRRLAYVTISGPVAPALRLIHWEGETMRDRQLVAGIVTGPVAWSPDGSQLYYAKIEAEQTTTWSDLYRYDLVTGREQRLTRGLRAIGPAPSADGRRLVFTSRDGLATRLLELDLDLADSLPVRPGSAALREILPAAGDAQRLAAGWFPDGRHLLVSSHEAGGGMDLLRLDPASGEVTPLVVGSRRRGGAGFVNQNARFTPDGRFIVFDSDRTGVYNLYAYELATGETFSVAQSLTGLFAPDVIWTELGPRLVAMEYTARGYQLSHMAYEPARWAPVSSHRPARDDRSVVSAAARPPTRSFSDEHSRTTPAVTASIRPYSPWSSLRPRFYLLLLGADETGPLVGAATYGYDAFQERFYSLVAGYGVGSGRPLLDFQYSAPLFGRRHATWGLHALQETAVDGDGGGTLQRGLALEAVYTWPGVFANSALWAQTGFWEQRRVWAGHSTGPSHSGQAATLGVRHEREWPVDHRNVQLDTRLMLTGLRDDGDRPRRGYVLTWHEAARFSWNLRRHMLDAALTLGTSTMEEGVTIGPDSVVPGQPMDWSLKAPGRDLIGRHAARLVLGLNSQLVHVGRGIGSWPVFMDDIGGRLYVEGGAVWTGLARAPEGRWGVGAEATMTAYVAYNVPVTVALGVAVNMNEDTRPMAAYVRLSLDDVAGGASIPASIPRRYSPSERPER